MFFSFRPNIMRHEESKRKSEKLIACYRNTATAHFNAQCNKLVSKLLSFSPMQLLLIASCLQFSPLQLQNLS